jgi:hypothetical protein
MIRATMLLADSAQAQGNKLYILGGGWSITGPGPGPTAIAIKLDVPWDQTNQKHVWNLDLLDADGDPVLLPTPEGEQPIQVSGEFEVGRPPGLPPGTPIDLSLAINIGPLPLPPGARYLWRLSIDGRTDENWQLGFMVRAANAGPTEGPG